MTLDEVLKRLAAECYAAGGQTEWAAAHGIARPTVSAVLGRARRPTDAILTALGLERVTRTTVSYRRIKR